MCMLKVRDTDRYHPVRVVRTTTRYSTVPRRTLGFSRYYSSPRYLTTPYVSSYPAHFAHRTPQGVQAVATTAVANGTTASTQVQVSAPNHHHHNMNHIQTIVNTNPAMGANRLGMGQPAYMDDYGAYPSAGMMPEYSPGMYGDGYGMHPELEYGGGMRGGGGGGYFAAPAPAGALMGAPEYSGGWGGGYQDHAGMYGQGATPHYGY